MPTPFRGEEGHKTTTQTASGLSGPAWSKNRRTLRNNMHENREISCTSWATNQDRPAKAINRTADMNVQEKSDCAVVPVNQLNNEGQPLAEAGEGMAQTQENIVQSHVRPTHSGKRMSQGLHSVRQAARFAAPRPR
jgi:hypothetical protein